MEGIFIDLSKAFDAIDHNKLVETFRYLWYPKIKR